MLDFIRDGASVGPKARIWTENRKNRVPIILTKIDGFSGYTKFCSNIVYICREFN